MNNEAAATAQRLTVQRNRALGMITQHGGTDGAHHKQWVLDQVVRMLTTPKGYENWVYDYEHNSNGEKLYTWDEGIAP